jgi:ElaB/YqjD/DUF883 family membrane-anchored ribosome-binding protein
MSAEPIGPAVEEAASPDSADARKALREALASAERGLSEAAKSAEKIIREGIETLRAQNPDMRAAESAVDGAQRFLVERVRERPVTAALAGVGLGLLLGLMLAGRGK